MRWIGRVVRLALWAGVAGGLALAGVSALKWQSDQERIREHVGDAVSDEGPPSRTMREALAFMVDRVGYEPVDDHYLLPAFEFLKPTARQVIEGSGGDCAYRARAYIVVLRQQRVEASKLALYDKAGLPVHAVVRVETEKGPYLVDLLFDIIHEDDEGGPIPLESLREPEVLRDSVRRAARGGNERAKGYPLDRYAFHEVRTINWDKSGAMRTLYRTLSALFGEDDVRSLPRPYVSEEPALMAACGGGAGAAGCLLLLGVGAWRRRRRNGKKKG